MTGLSILEPSCCSFASQIILCWTETDSTRYEEQLFGYKEAYKLNEMDYIRLKEQMID